MKVFMFSCLVITLFMICVNCKEQECSSGESKTISCINCRCVGGIWACARKACIERKRRDIYFCTPGAIFQKDCNTCVCTADGRNAACTLKTCTGYPTDTNETSCVPGTTFKKDCNTCFCTKDGKDAACTLKACF